MATVLNRLERPIDLADGSVLGVGEQRAGVDVDAPHNVQLVTAGAIAVVAAGPGPVPGPRREYVLAEIVGEPGDGDVLAWDEDVWRPAPPVEGSVGGIEDVPGLEDALAADATALAAHEADRAAHPRHFGTIKGGNAGTVDLEVSVTSSGTAVQIPGLVKEVVVDGLGVEGVVHLPNVFSPANNMFLVVQVRRGSTVVDTMAMAANIAGIAATLPWQDLTPPDGAHTYTVWAYKSGASHPKISTSLNGPGGNMFAPRLIVREFGASA